ncbi:MAG TPA: hypothetical protein VGM13_13590 [Thermoanaerobaculia bacterium]
MSGDGVEQAAANGGRNVSRRLFLSGLIALLTARGAPARTAEEINRQLVAELRARDRA